MHLLLPYASPLVMKMQRPTVFPPRITFSPPLVYLAASGLATLLPLCYQQSQVARIVCSPWELRCDSMRIFFVFSGAAL